MDTQPKATHILIPIGDIYTKLMIVCSGYLRDYPKVDLSEEGIKAKAERYAAKAVDYGDPQWPVAMGYQQCAKDLLNTKP